MVKVVLNQEQIEEIPDSSSVYALFSMENGLECWYVGYTNNLRESITKHFDPDEPNIYIRYLMLSCKTKLLHYEIELNGITGDTSEKVNAWISEFQPRKILIRNEESRERISKLIQQSSKR
jgi:excinuclease UvrABC nuclease subunit